MSNKTVILDPGHGMDATGLFARPLMNCNGLKAVAVPDSMYEHKNEFSPGFYREDTGTLYIAKQAARYLEAQGHTVFLTRQGRENAKEYLSSLSDNKWKRQYWKSWKWVKEFTIEKKADIFVSIHTNAGRGKGSACFWASTPNGVDLSWDLVSELRDQLNIKTRNVSKHRFLILRDICDGRAAFLECLFHDNINEIKLMLSRKGIDSIAKAVADGIHKHTLKF